MAKTQAQTQKLTTQQKLELARQSMAKTVGTKTAAKNAAQAPQRKPRVKATETQEPVAQTSVDSKLMAVIDEYMAELKASMPSWKRTLVAFLISAACACGIGWLIGTVIGYAMIGAMVMTGSLSLVYLIYGFGVLLAAYAGLKVTQKVGGYILTGNIDRDVGRAWKWTKGLFTREPQAVAA